MRRFNRVFSAALCGVMGSALVMPAAYAQNNADDNKDYRNQEIVVTAQRTAQSAQDVPIAVSAFSAEALESQQIENSSDLQLTLPNITFTKTNFTSSSFTIRGIGDLCVGVSCDQATAIHLNESPLFATRLFETEFFDLERVEVLRGPQGTLFGRNATSGVVNVVTAKPKLGAFEAAFDGEYGNFQAIKAKGMVNIPLGETMAARVSGIYVNRDGYTKNLFDGSRIDGRKLYSVRGSLRWEPTADTTIDIMGSYFREDDDRMRIQKQLCQRDPTGILGCLNTRLDAAPFNSNATFTAALSSKEFLAIRGIPTGFALQSIYGPDTYAGTTIPTDVRTVNTAFKPEYFTSELILQGKLKHDFGPISVQLSGNYQNVKLDSRQDYNLNVGNRALYTAGLTNLQAAATGAYGAALTPYFAPIAAAIIPNGPNGPLCVSDTDPTGMGSFGGNKICSNTALQFDRSNQNVKSWSAEAILSSDFDGPFNFLVGGIYADSHLTENSYYVNAFAIDYVAGVLGSFTAVGSGLPPAFLGTPFFRNNSDDLKVKSYGLFGEAYFEFNDKLKLTAGLRYNNDKKTVSARSTLAGFLVPYSATSTDSTNYGAGFDADPATVCPTTNPVTGAQNSAVLGALGSAIGCEAFQNRAVKFNKLTGRVVLDYKITEDNLLYASYSRGYKSGGINPPLQPIFEVPETFDAEQVDAFEIGLKNNFGNALQLNLTAFYYKYKKLQLSKIVARTAVNDNVDADIYGLEAEAIIRPASGFVVNLGASYLHTKVTEDKLTSDPHDFGGGRADAVIIKDLTNASNCAVIPTTAGNAAGANGFVTAINGSLGLQAPVAFPSDGGIASTGAYSICSVLQAQAAGVGAAFGGIQVLNGGVLVNIKGNQLPQAPNYKFSAGVQYTAEFGNGMSLVPRVDMAYTGNSYSSIFNGHVSRMEGFTQVNGQIQLNGTDDRWYVRAFVQNAFDSDSVTGQYLTDQSSGLYTNIFTLEPRRFGIGAGVKF